MSIHDRLLVPENLNYAWKKAKKIYSTLDGYVNSAELSEFEINLEERLIAIHKRFEKGVWHTKKLRPLPRPKKIENDVAVDRQYYHVAVEDQVAWIAVANALGPELDQQMPPWSYGNRIYRPAWYEHGEDRKSVLEIGPYRHASGHLYRKFQHSWPLFRRHVALTARAMARALPPELEHLDQADRLAAISAKKEGLRYLYDGFWLPKPEQTPTTRIYHASFDLKQFYPNLKTNAVFDGLTTAVGSDDRLRTLLSGMLRFRLDDTKMPQNTLKNVEPSFGRRLVGGIPTGLFVAGFLANAAMLRVDEAVNQRVIRKRSLAHFRFVDDHLVLSYDFDELCGWLEFYRNLLQDCDTGVDVNPDKYDPVSLGDWVSMRSADSAVTTARSSQKKEERERKAREAAIQHTALDGANPTALLTKTLGQISAIAAANVNTLDDEDLEERLKLLEWLLLANIPEHEIRPDTRAAFAAGRIATLAPILVREADGLVETARSLQDLKARARDPETTSPKDTAEHMSAIEETNKKLALLEEAQKRDEDRQLRHCFSLLLQASREYPGKPRLFYRIHEYCRITGYGGLSEIAEWIKETRARGYTVWADYYGGLSLQVLARGVLLATRTWTSENALRSDREAVLRHLEDVCRIDPGAFLDRQENLAWFHNLSRTEFGVALLAIAEVVRHTHTNGDLAKRLARLASQFVSVSFSDSAEAWERETGLRPGVWAHLTESALSVDDRPTASWKRFGLLLSSPRVTDIRASRRYPEFLSEGGWHRLLDTNAPLPETDSGWIREMIVGNEERVATAFASKKKAFTRAARSLHPPNDGWITLTEWTRFLSQELSPFDPRRSEWTALEIVRQLVSPIVNELSVHQTRLDLLHPNNVLVPNEWRSAFPSDRERARVSWEEWRHFANPNSSAQITLRPSATSVKDYRYFAHTQGGRKLNEWERRLTGVGRLLLDQLRLNHKAPRIWNIRGNEQVFPLPQTRWIRSLAISSLTLQIVEGCLGTRRAETRSITRNPSLFGWIDGQAPNDADFDTPLLMGPNELLNAIASAQQVLVANQLAVSMNQPRQLIPFRLTDFAAGTREDEEGDADDE